MMNIAGWSKSSLIDFPEHASTVIFVGGCNYRCAYCHNPDIVFAKERSADKDEVIAFLKKRKRFLDGICITGGEPTLDGDLEEFARQVKGIGYDIKLDTNGSRPEVIRALIEKGLLDYVAMDIKGPLPRYCEITGVKADIDSVRKSIELLMSEDVESEFRTTVCREIIGEKDIKDICLLISGAKRYFLQNFRGTGTDRSRMAGLTEGMSLQSSPDTKEETYGKKEYGFSPHSEKDLAKFKEIAQNYIQEVGIR